MPNHLTWSRRGHLLSSHTVYEPEERARLRLIGEWAGPFHDSALARVLDSYPKLETLILSPCASLSESFLSSAIAKLPNIKRSPLHPEP